jgi:hypothetical protein
MSSKCFLIMIKFSDFLHHVMHTTHHLLLKIYLFASIIDEDIHDHHLEC